MKRTLFVTSLIFFLAWSTAWADKAVESAQQKLKEGGFYYGEISGTKDADTTAAIRRYQIRNGLKITGELDAETQHSLGLTSKPATTPAPRPAHTPGPPPPDYSQDHSAPSTAPAPRPPIPDRDEAEDEEEAPPSQVPPAMPNAAPLGGTPYESAPPQVQQDIVSRVQIILLRQGFYSDEVDGRYGPALSFALRNYQAQLGLHPTGRLDIETLALLHLLPEQRVTGRHRFNRPLFAPRPRYWRPDERIYIPR